jgi:hypothetical protein
LQPPYEVSVTAAVGCPVDGFASQLSCAAHRLAASWTL